MRSLSYLAAALALASPITVQASPLANVYHNGFGVEFNETDSPLARESSDLERRQNMVELRIMPLGASIMEGLKSTTHAGLRQPLRSALRFDGWPVNMVGSKSHGTGFKDNNHEAVSGAKLANVLANYKGAKGYKPNIVLINVGTNNANDNDGVAQAYDSMNAILNEIWNSPDMSQTCVILSTLLPTNHPTGRSTRLRMNDDYRKLVQDRGVRDSKCIYLADMEPEGAGKNFLGVDQPVWAADEVGGTLIHPNDEGYRRMAYVFYAAIRRALAADRVKPAAPLNISGNKFCDKVPGNGEFAAGTQKGSGQGDGTYAHVSQGPVVRAEIESQWDRDQWRFARLFNRQYDDLVGWYEFGQNDHRFGVWKNSANGQGSFNKIGDLLGNIYCIPRGLHFADVNGDGLDDIVCISPSGDLHMSLNLGNGGGNTPPSFRYIGRIKTGEEHQDRIRLADIDGDGRVDYGVVQNNGDVRFWRNGGTGDTPEYWQPLGIRSTMKPGDSGMTGLAGIRFADINGDGRDDWMYMNEAGRTITHTNTRSCKKGREGDGLHVAWRQAFYSGSSSGPTHGGLSYLQDKAEDWRSKIHFARVYGTKPTFDNLGVQDYVYIKSERVSSNNYKVSVNVWKNLGSGGTKLEADGNKYCNMHGWDNGRSDLVWVYSDGRMDLYPHAGKRHVSGSESYWSPWVPGFWRPPGGAQVDRRNLHLADWDGDGACDIIWVDPSRNNRVRVFINKYKRDKQWNFQEISAPDLQCNARNGIGIHDLAVRFAHINTSKKASYMCINPDGLIRARMHGADDGWSEMMQIKRADGADRANLRFADVSGSGTDDIVWVDKFTGDASVWYNEGRHSNPAANTGSHYSWRKSSGNAYSGSYAGTCQNFVNLDSDPRADLHSIMGTWTNQAETWYSPTCGFFDYTGDDDGGVRDPKLPVQPGNPLTNPDPNCVAVRTYLHGRLFINDVITMELWVSGKKVCHMRAAEFFMDTGKFYQWDCDDLNNSEIVWQISASNNGYDIIIKTKSKSGLIIQEYRVKQENFAYNDWCSKWTQSGGCAAKDLSYESCSFTPDSCNNGETCNLCDGKVVCDSPP